MSEFRMSDTGAGLTTQDRQDGLSTAPAAGEALAETLAAGVLAQAAASIAATPSRPGTSEIMPWKFHVTVDRSRDALLTDFGRDTLDDRYLLPGESYQDLFARVAAAYADDAPHAQRLYDYISRLWFMPATPVLSNGGTGLRGGKGGTSGFAGGGSFFGITQGAAHHFREELGLCTVSGDPF
jgi:ribonucleoside-diphosphate reductase alpha chain